MAKGKGFVPFGKGGGKGKAPPFGGKPGKKMGKEGSAQEERTESAAERKREMKTGK